MVPHSGEDSPIWTDVVSTGEALKSLAPITGTRMSSRAAVVIDWESEWARHYAIGPISSENPTDSWGNFAPSKSWHQSLWEAGIATDVVGVDNDFSSYDLIVVPAVFIDYPQMTQALRQAAERGAHIVITAPSGVVDSQLGAVLGGYLGSLSDLAGVRAGAAGLKRLPPLPVCSGRFPGTPRKAGLSALHTLMAEAVGQILPGFQRSPAGKLATEVSGTQERTLTR